MKIKMIVMDNSIKIESRFQKIEFQLRTDGFKSYELDKNNFKFTFPCEIREKSSELIVLSRKRLSLFEKVISYIRANEVFVYVSKVHQDDLTIRSLYDFCTSVLTGRIVKIVAAEIHNKDLLKPKHLIMDLEEIKKYYKKTGNKNYLLNGMKEGFSSS